MANGESIPSIQADAEAAELGSLQGFIYLAETNPWLVYSALDLCSRPQDVSTFLEYVDTYPEGLEALRLTSQVLETRADKSIAFADTIEDALPRDANHKKLVSEHRKNPTEQNTFAVRVSRLGFGLRQLMREAVVRGDEPYQPPSNITGLAS